MNIFTTAVTIFGPIITTKTAPQIIRVPRGQGASRSSVLNARWTDSLDFVGVARANRSAAKLLERASRQGERGTLWACCCCCCRCSWWCVVLLVLPRLSTGKSSLLRTSNQNSGRKALENKQICHAVRNRKGHFYIKMNIKPALTFPDMLTHQICARSRMNAGCD